MQTNVTTETATVFGIDSHARTTTACALVRETGEVETRTFRGNDYGEMRAWMARFPRPARGFYEAGCTGFVPARMLSDEDAGVEVVPVAPSKMPSSAESRTRKNDRNDAARIARLAVAGELHEVWVPPVAVEGLRDLVHALDDLRDQRQRACQRVTSLLLRHGLAWDGRAPSGRPRKAWGRAFRAWLGRVELADPASRAALAAAVRAADSAMSQYDDLLAEAAELAAASPLGPQIAALSCLKCVRFATALAFCAAVGDFSRFRSGRAITSHLGLAPSESSSGGSTRAGGITRCGDRLVRRMLVECAWAAARARPNLPKACPPGVPAAVRERAAALSRRLCSRRASMLARGVPPCKANAATAAELARFMLFLGKEAQAAS